MITGKKWERLGTGELLTEDAAEELGHLLEPRVYTKILLWLLFLTVITVGVAAIPIHSELFHVGIAMLIASVKAVLVVMYFMHLKFEKPIFWTIAIYPLFIFGLMLFGTVGEVVFTENPLPLSGETSTSFELPSR